MRRTLILLVSLAAACAPKDRAPRPITGMGLVPPRPKPEFALVSDRGAPYDFRRETDGYATIVYFGYTNCPDVCPLHMANIAHALQGVSPEERARLRVIFVTVDPARDSAPVLRAWLAHFDTTFVGLTGTLAQVNAAEKAFGIPEAKRESEAAAYTMGHSAMVFGFTADDSLRVVWPFGTKPEDWAKAIPELIAWAPGAAGR
ncbi:MAG TPA: SCO family protein [bacterium]|nr:SCO family protein [bacterium]